jgi:uncharacterized tellurite resistance protein B-like protein
MSEHDVLDRACHESATIMKEHIDTITDLLLGSAYSDKRLEGEELRAINKMICKLLGTDEVPAEQAARLKSFNPAKFDAAAAAASLKSETSEHKRKILELIASVSESDDVIDMDEDAYLRKVAKGLGMENEIDDLTIEVLEDDDIEHFFDDDA